MSGILMSNPVGAMFDKTKGSVKNRAKCAGAHAINNVTADVLTVAGAGASLVAGTGIATVGSSKYVLSNLHKLSDYKGIDKLKAAAENVLDKTSGTIAKGLEKFKGTEKIVDKLSSVFDKGAKVVYKAISPKNAKGKFIDFEKFMEKIQLGCLNKYEKAGLIVVATGLLATLAAVGIKNLHKNGQIDQKYTDKAKLENTKI